LSSIDKGNEFENKIAEFYELLGNSTVKRNMEISGHQIDILLIHSFSGVEIKIAVECKYVGGKNNLRKNDAMESINNLVDLRNKNLINKILIVTTNGFSKTLAVTAEDNDISLITFNQLLRQEINFIPYLKSLINNFENDELSKFYVEQNIVDRKTSEVHPISKTLNDMLKNPEINLISILGEYGIGKTSFCKKLAYNMAKNYIENPLNARIPIFIKLRDYAKSLNLRQLITDLLINEFGLHGFNYLLFNKMNDTGLFLIIFDGFDEMTQKVFFDLAYANFKAISKIANSRNSKVILTCRTEFFRSKMKEKEILLDIDESSNFKSVYLRGFSHLQIQKYLKKRIPLVENAGKWEYYYRKICDIPELEDIATRPVLLNILIKYLPQIIEEEKDINIYNLMKTAIDKEIKRKLHSETIIIKAQDRLKLMKLLATYMFLNYELSIYYKDIPKLIKLEKHFELKTKDEIEFHFHNFLTSSFLNRDHQGNYSFSHRAFVEFLVVANISESNQVERNNLMESIKKMDSRYLQGLLPFGTIEFYEEILKDHNMLINGDRGEQIIWLNSWVNYHILESKNRRPLPVLDVNTYDSNKKVLIKFKNDEIDMINLSDCNVKIIPENLIDVIKEVKHINLDYNSSIRFNSALKKLKLLDYLSIRSSEIKTFPESITKISNLRILDLSDNDLEKLPSSISKLRNLKELILEENNFDNFPKDICNLENLEILDLSANNLNYIPKSISNLKKLKSLILYSNRIKEIPTELSELINLEDLYIYNNKIKTLPNQIKKLNKIRKLVLSGNEFDYFPEVLFYLKNLDFVDISCNNISILPKFLLKMNLKHLVIDYSLRTSPILNELKRKDCNISFQTKIEDFIY